MKIKAHRFITTLAGVTFAGFALAANASDPDCRSIADGAARLACYDRVNHGEATVAAAPRVSLIGERWGLDPVPAEEDLVLRFHNPSYFAIRWSDAPNDSPTTPTEGGLAAPVPLDNTEAKFQFSFKARIFKTENRRVALWAAYTQQSNWQIFNGDLSRPFRETNYQPELIFTIRPDLGSGDFRWRLLNIGIVHQSNGRADPLSRSWNRVYAQFGFENKGFVLLVRPWYRFKENIADDNNPDIAHYYGYGDIVALYKTGRGHTFTVTGRGNISTGKGSGEFEWSTPPMFGPFKGYLQVFTGYGESLIDYNWRQTTVGVGLSFNDIF